MKQSGGKKMYIMRMFFSIISIICFAIFLFNCVKLKKLILGVYQSKLSEEIEHEIKARIRTIKLWIIILSINTVFSIIIIFI